MEEKEQKDTSEKLENLNDEMAHVGNKLRLGIIGINIVCVAGYDSGANKNDCLLAIESYGENLLELIDATLLDSFEKQIWEVKDLLGKEEKNTKATGSGEVQP